jgi:hypothetical protein
MLRSVGLFTVSAYAAIIVALISGIPSLAHGSWQAAMYPDLFFNLSKGFFPAMIAITLLALGTSSADEILAENLSQRPWAAWIYFIAVALLIVAGLYFLVESMSSMLGYMTTGIENSNTPTNAAKI